MKTRGGFAGLMLLVLSLPTLIAISTTYFFSPKVLICDLLRRSIKSRCCMLLLGMGKCRPASLYHHPRQPIRWMSGRMLAMPRGSFGHTGVRMRGYLTMLDCFVQAMGSS